MCSERQEAVRACPHCGGLRLRRWGHLAGRQRYRCLACSRTFTAQTGLPQAYLKYQERWRTMSVAFAERWTIRQTAAQLGIHASTAFRWRHRWLDFLRQRPAPRLGGIVEIVETRLPESAKGQRHLPRQPRRREPRWLRLHEVQLTWIVLACDRQGHRYVAKLDWPTVSDLPQESPRVVMFESALLPRLCPWSTIYTEQRTWYASLCRRHRFPHRVVRDFVRQCLTPADRRWMAESPEVRLGHHVNNAGALRRRLKPWLLPFRGVATRYLDNYLTWFADPVAAAAVAELSRAA